MGGCCNNKAGQTGKSESHPRFKTIQAKIFENQKKKKATEAMIIAFDYIESKGASKKEAIDSIMNMKPSYGISMISKSRLVDANSFDTLPHLIGFLKNISMSQFFMILINLYDEDYEEEKVNCKEGLRHDEGQDSEICQHRVDSDFKNRTTDSQQSVTYGNHSKRGSKSSMSS